MGNHREYQQGGRFTGHVGRTEDESTEAWPAPNRPPDGAPNVVFVLLDDVGFAQLGCYGSDIDTPTFDRLAGGGVRYRNFHTTAMCSPTRACLLTGCNSHTTGMGGIADQATGYPGYHAQISKRTGFLSEMLLAARLRHPGGGQVAPGAARGHGPRFEPGPVAARPRLRALLRVHGRRDQPVRPRPDPRQPHRRTARPPRTRGTTSARTWPTGPSSSSTTSATPSPTSRSSSTSRLVRATPPTRRPGEWIDRYAGRFDDGWDAWRAATHRRQLEMGILPEGTELSATPRLDRGVGRPSTDDHRRPLRPHDGGLRRVPRPTPTIRSAGSSTTSSSWASWTTRSSWCCPTTAPAPRAAPRLVEHQPLLQRRTRDLRAARRPTGTELGGPHDLQPLSLRLGPRRQHAVPALEARRPTRAASPTRSSSTIPTDPAARGEVRPQYAHVVDLVPTVLDLIGIDRPEQIDGVAQVPLAGTSLAPTLDDGDADRGPAPPVLRAAGVTSASTTEGGRPSPTTPSSASPTTRPPIRSSPSTPTAGSCTTWPRTSPSATTWPRPSPSG